MEYLRPSEKLNIKQYSLNPYDDSSEGFLFTGASIMKEFQVEMEHKYSKKIIPNRIWEEVSNEEELINLFKDHKEAKAVLFMVLHKNKEQPIQNAVALISSQGFSWEEAINLLEKYSDKGIYKIIQYPSKKLAVKPLIELDKTVRDSFEEKTVLPPLAIKPKDWTNNSDGGYYTVKHNAVLGKGNNHDDKLSLDSLNKLQNIQWKINPTVLANFHNDVCYSKEKETKVQLDLLDKNFYFMWQFDKRGRMYSKGYEINFQSSEYHKALLDFSHGEKLSDEGLDNLKIAIANAYGYDKLLWEERIEKGTELINTHFITNLSTGEHVIDPEGANEPILFTKYMEAYFEAVQGLEVHSPVALDMTASGKITCPV